MGRKKRFSRAVRKQQSADESPNNTISVDSTLENGKYDTSNALILESKPTEPKLTKKQIKKKKVLSKKALKKLQDVVKRRKKKLDRSKIMEEYSKSRISNEEMEKMVSTSLVQTKGLKHLELLQSSSNKRLAADELFKSGKKFKEADVEEEEIGNDLNVVKYKSSDEDSSCSSENEEENVKTEIAPHRHTVLVENSPKIKEISKIDESKKNAFNNNVEEEQLQETFYVPITRTEEIEKWRRTLPVTSEEQTIVESIRYNDVVIICGETGSGKTTQIPQFLYEAGYSRNKVICITEPRRVAAMAMSRRVAHEMSLTSKNVSYHIRYESNVTSDTKIKFVTDGVLLREVQQDFLLSAYSVVIVDEAHERSVFSDILVGLLSRIVPLRRKKGDPLKLVIMSATLRVDDFTANRRLFKVEPPVIKIETRQFPVTIKFQKHTPENYMEAAFKKACQIHRTQPSGGILIFVTGRNQVNSLCRKLQHKFPSSLNLISKKEKLSSQERTEFEIKKSESTIQPKCEIEAEIEDETDSESDDCDEDFYEDGENLTCKEPMFCLPLFSQLPKQKQEAVFKGCPDGHRLVIIATNVAETSLTIPGIKYVVDTGKAKSKVYDKTTGISAFIVTWASKASAQQRAGRAGRTSPGTCFRLYSSAVFNNDFAKFGDPEILVKPIDDLVLQMKSLNVTNVMNFPFPTPPSIDALEASEKRLLLMEALEESRTNVTSDGRICTRLTPLGKLMTHFPISPRYSKMLALTDHEHIPHVVAILAGLTVQELFMTSDSSDAIRKMKTKWTGINNEHLLGDLMIILKAIGASEYMSASSAFHQKIGLRHKAMIEVHKLRKQLLSAVERVYGDDSEPFPAMMKPPTDTDAKYLRQLSVAAFSDQVAKKNDPSDKNLGKIKHSYQSIQVESPVFLDPSSVLKHTMPEYVVYQEIEERDGKMYMRNVVAIEPEWLPENCRKLLHEQIFAATQKT